MAGMWAVPDAGRDGAAAQRSPAQRLGERSLYRVGDLAKARHHFEVAHGGASSGGDPEGQALAALGLGGLWVHEWRDSLQAALVRTRQRRALTALEPGSPVRLRLQARLAGLPGGNLRSGAGRRGRGSAGGRPVGPR